MPEKTKMVKNDQKRQDEEKKDFPKDFLQYYPRPH